MKYVKVRYALNGVEGLKLVEEISPVVIILDYMMPDFDGIEVFQELRNRYGSKVPPTNPDRFTRLGNQTPNLRPRCCRLFTKTDRCQRFTPPPEPISLNMFLE